ncbi:Variant surface glycoprotein [Trypanosoma congolense IL3000]|uniref:Variant surface glycoprotein n=1 Tax=Trypanosoma congolense (strain IL3000) TaxID=1068625 RepID=F9WIG5_TRYCI|nr:Variant surface glycoprotein [Trypanosoma congolense IL3000]
MMKLFMVCLVVVCVCASEDKKNHNGDHHATLCGLLGTAAHKWKTTNHPGVKKALSQAIFGHTQGGDIEKHSQVLPSDYHQSGNRENWCWHCKNYETHHPGKSIPHDLLCLCTVGSKGHEYSDRTSSLCGRNGVVLNVVHGWSSSNSGVEHLKDAWEKIVKPCLQNGPRVNIDQAVANFSSSMENRDTPNWSASHTGNCKGDSGHSSICVGYDGWCLHGNDYHLWWKDFVWALRAPNLTEDQLNSTTFLNATRDTADSSQTGQQGSSTQAMPSTTSASSTTEESPGKVLPLLSNQQSSASLTHPLLCLLSASFFI